MIGELAYGLAKKTYRLLNSAEGKAAGLRGLLKAGTP